MNPSNVLGKLSPSITAMIRADHSHVVVTSHRYLADLSPGRKKAIVETCCRALEIHAQLEEEIFYPAARDALDEDLLLNEATVEHESAKELIAQIQSMEASDPMFDATVIVLGE